MTTFNKLQKYSTLLKGVQYSLVYAARFNRSDMVAPAAILWTDADSQWGPLVSQLRPLMPELLTLGEYNPDEKTGPAIWLRCVVERALPDVELPEAAIPIIYMPNVSRQTLRAVEECPDSLRPLVGLQYRGAVWTQRNGRDWTVEAFLVSEDGGLGLDVARDRHTRRSMIGALVQLAVTPISRFIGKKLEAEDFDKLMIEDTPRDLLVWMNSPAETQEKWDGNKWTAFISRCKADYGFDPEKDGEIVAGEKLGMREDEVWKNLWTRFEESPLLYPGLPKILRRSKPSGKLIFDKEPWPDENYSEEKSLREDLLKLTTMSPAHARQKINDLEASHGKRRDWVWAKIGMSSLAMALEHLALMAEQTFQSLGGDSAEAMAAIYKKSGYNADSSAMVALESVKSIEDNKAIEAALRSIYLPWLDDAARHFQKLVAANPLPSGHDELPGIIAETGECLLFADGLRFDISRRLTDLAEERRLKVSSNWRWAALPTVTATAKPALSPVAEQIIGKHLGEEFQPEIKDGGKPLTIDRFRELLTLDGYQVFSSSEIGDPDQADARAWTEFGELDKLGHTLQSKLASRIAEQLELLIERIQELLKAGWKQVRVITDHGWLLVPGGLPAVKLPKYLTECRWARCAAIKDHSKVDFPMAVWHWNSHEYFAYGPGINCFSNGNEYAHGGISLQECLIPDLQFSLSEVPAKAIAKILEIHWLGMRCRATIDPGGAKITADLRTKPNDETSSVATSKMVSADGHVSLLVEDEELEGTVVSLVMIDASGLVIGKQATTIGGDE
ncbi:MAG: BREX-1 system phosphatase PglZ type B [Thermodesulfobacteriota bacterium]|nr:BREX-1 system phosphatase PglZ type B [Thermodesulfobacteriota bacterium]